MYSNQSGAPEVIVCGHLCLDLLPDMHQVSGLDVIQPGKLVEVGAAGVATGGPVSNTGLALHTLGIPVTLMSAVGDDLIGKLIVLCLQKIDPGLSANIRVLPGQASSYSIVIAPGGADRMFLHCTGTNASFGPENVDYEKLRTTRIFHLGYPPLLPRLVIDHGAGLIELFMRAQATGVITSLEMAMPDPRSESGQADWGKILGGTLPNVDVFVPSIEEMMFVLRRADYESWGSQFWTKLSAAYLQSMADELIGMGAAIVGFKLGHLGLYLRTASVDRLTSLTSKLPIIVKTWANFTGWQPAFQVEVAGTTGAGDTAYAGLLGALLRGHNPAEAMRLACAVGACCVERVDAVSGIRSWAATEGRLAAGWSSRPEQLLGM